MEIIIIAALIALLSTIAVFQVASIMANVRRKVAMADGRTVADAITTARFDLNMYVKPGYLHLSAPEIDESGTPGVTLLKHDFDCLGYVDTLSGPSAARIVNKWSGPYFPTPDARSSVAQGGNGYVCDMMTSWTASSDPITVVSWPADPWGNPYVVYLVKIKEGVDASTGDRITPLAWIESASDDANYRAMVVSYGPNGIPGGSADDAFMSEQIRLLGNDYRLYSETSETGLFKALDSDAYTSELLTALDNTYVDAGGNPVGYLSNVDAAYDWVPGIQNGAPFTHNFSGEDKYVLGSDDIIIVIR